ncbi:MAG: hypothetical protein MI717_14250 [Spirochaetales bacterium]|nr:hypothetical protein [Spirochaetales bacterium]
MKKTACILLLFFCILFSLLGQEKEEASSPWLSLHMIGLNSWAPVGVGAEFFFGPIGLTAQLTVLPLGVNGNFVFMLEPGIGFRGYLNSNLRNSLYFGLSTHYSTGFGIVRGGPTDIPINVLRINALAGFNMLFGTNERGRLAFELGPRYNIGLVKGDTIRPSWLLIHAQILMGYTW